MGLFCPFFMKIHQNQKYSSQNSNKGSKLTKTQTQLEFKNKSKLNIRLKVNFVYSIPSRMTENVKSVRGDPNLSIRKYSTALNIQISS